MTNQEFLAHLSTLGIRVWAAGDRLRCSAPKGALTSDLRAELARRRDELLALDRTSHDPQSGRLGRLPRTDPIPLSFAQERLWFLDRFAPQSPIYNVPTALRLRGELNVEALESSLGEIIQRHDALRTVFPDVGGRPTQVIEPPRADTITLVDLRQLPRHERNAEANRLSRVEAQRPFDLADGPLYRVSLFRLDDRHWVLLIVLHHIVADAWSLGILQTELMTLYRARVTGTGAELPPLDIQYPDYARWQRQSLANEVLESHLTYWRERLGGRVPLLELPTDRPRPAIRTFQGATVTHDLPRALADAVAELGRRQDVTLFMTLLAAFKILLFRYTEQPDIVIGSPVADRTRVETEPLIGCFVNTLVLRTDLAGRPSVRALLTRIRETTLGAYAHQELPFEKLVEALRPERDLGHAPLFQIMFGLQNVPTPVLELPGMTVTPLDIDAGAARVDLTVLCAETPAGLRTWWEYNTDLFDAGTIHRMIGHFGAILEGMTRNPEQLVDELPMLSAAERRELLAEWSPTPIRYPKGPTIHQRFEEQVELTPDAPAVTCDRRTLTYAELNRRANQLAHVLGALGVTRGQLVGLYADRSLELAVGVLGILKAGGAYVPLDPAYPPDRVAFMLEDAGVSVLVTDGQTPDELSPDPRVVSVDTRRALDERKDVDVNPTPRSTADDPAYVIYTSGSTGRPKGVVVSHYNVLRLFQATAAWFRFGPDETWTMFHSPAFDFSVWEMWGALLHGGRLVIVPHWLSRAPEAFLELLERERVTVLNQTPSAFWTLLQAEESRGVPSALSLRLVIFGGESLDVRRLKPWIARHGDARPRLVNMYGITETTVHVTYRPITAADLVDTVGSPIGRPIPDLELCVLDPRGHPVPVGVPGELYVGGAGLSLGYLGRPQLTAERFVTLSHPELASGRFYRTGDLVRYRDNGDLEYLGRLDHQVKIRGYRIELGEIETVLRAHPGVREAAVRASEDTTGGGRLIAYVVANHSAPPTVAELQAHLRRSLPDSMVPAAFVFLEALPITASGKLDRDALPMPDRSRPDLSNTFVEPRTTTERLLADIWRTVLDLARVGVDDNFFDLGGHSLLCVRVHAMLRDRLGAEVPIVRLFQSPTIRSLAEFLDGDAPVPTHDDAKRRGSRQRDALRR